MLKILHKKVLQRENKGNPYRPVKLKPRSSFFMYTIQMDTTSNSIASQHNDLCSCAPCHHQREADGTQDMYLQKLRAMSAEFTDNSQHNDLCSCAPCHHQREADGTQDMYLQKLRAMSAEFTDKCESTNTIVPLCYKCKVNRAWRGECIECYMIRHLRDSEGNLIMPSTLQNIRKGYYMEEESYALSRRKQGQFSNS